jgi:hypothetical protein
MLQEEYFMNPDKQPNADDFRKTMKRACEYFMTEGIFKHSAAYMEAVAKAKKEEQEARMREELAAAEAKLVEANTKVTKKKAVQTPATAKTPDVIVTDEADEADEVKK